MSLWLKCLLALIEVKKDQEVKTVDYSEVDQVVIEVMDRVIHSAKNIRTIEDIDKLIPDAAMITYIRNSNPVF